MSSLLHKPIRMRRCSGCNTSEAKEFDPGRGGFTDGWKPRRQCVHHIPRPGGEEVPSVPVPKGRRSKRVMSRRRASLVIDLDWNPKRLPCIVLDSSKEGFRLRGSFHLKRNQVVEIILDQELTRLSTLQSGLGRHSWLQAGRRGRPGNRLVDWKIARGWRIVILGNHRACNIVTS